MAGKVQDRRSAAARGTTVCPRCGQPIEAAEPPGKGPGGRLASLIGIFVLIVVGFGLGVVKEVVESSWRAHRLATQTAKPPPSWGAVKITAEALAGEYRDDEAAADGRYKRRMLEVTGLVEGLSLDLLDDPQVILAAPGSPTPVWFGFEPRDLVTVAKLRPGQSVTILGECHGLIEGRLLCDDSTLLKAP